MPTTREWTLRTMLVAPTHSGMPRTRSSRGSNSEEVSKHTKMPEEVSKYPKMPEGWNPSDDSDDEYMPAPRIAAKKRAIDDDTFGTKPPAKKEKESTDPKVEMNEETRRSSSSPPSAHLAAKVGEMSFHLIFEVILNFLGPFVSKIEKKSLALR